MNDFHLASLLDPAAYPEPVTCVQMLQTHISWIFLTDTHAWKIKKPVNFGFLDFSTPEKRLFYCNEELRLNRRLSPDMYEAVVELIETEEGKAAFHGKGKVIDHAVLMKRLPADRMFDRLIDENRIGDMEIDTLSSIVADFHKNAASSEKISEYGRLENIRLNWQENFDQVVQFGKSTLPEDERLFISRWVDRFIRKNARLLSERVEKGYIRECNGDMHLENISLAERGILIFDCIEFNERFRCCDTVADIAFLLMDLDFHKRPDLSEKFLAGYRIKSGDDFPQELLVFYKIYRSFVKGKVESFRLNDPGISEKEKREAAEKGRRYFRLSRGYIEKTELKPTLFITCGLTGSGKSRVTEELSFELCIKKFSSDLIRKEMAGIPAISPQFDDFGKGLYSDAMTERVYDRLAEHAEQELSSGRSLIVDASFIRRADRLRFSSIASVQKAGFLVLYLECDEAENISRLQRRSKLGNSVSDGRVEILGSQRMKFEPPVEAEESRMIKLDSGRNLHMLLNSIYERLHL